MAQIRQVVSESLQATIRRLLPSQQGFSEDLQATNVITPIIDLTPTAEGSQLPTDLSRAIAFGSQTSFGSHNSTVTIVNTTGFYRIFGCASVSSSGTADEIARFDLSDGLTTKTVWLLEASQDGVGGLAAIQFDFVVFMNSGETLSGFTTARTHMDGSSRQIADINGNIVNPSGFTVS